jgi:small subunit ribosomal protein S16
LAIEHTAGYALRPFDPENTAPTMSVVIRMKREGRKNRPSYRISVANPRNPRDGATLERIGIYDPMSAKPEQQLRFDVERARYWLSVGAQPSETIASIFRRHKVYEGLPVPKKRERPGRGKKTKTGERRAATQKARADAKAARPAHRRKPKKVAEKKPG